MKTLYKESIGRYIAIIHRSSHGILEKKLSDAGIGRGQYDFLFVIGRHEGLNQKELAKKLSIGKSTTAKVVKNLVKLGFIKRVVDEQDKRNYHLYLTEKGKEFKPQLDQTFEDMLNVISKEFSEEEYQLLLMGLKKVATNMRNEKERLNNL